MSSKLKVPNLQRSGRSGQSLWQLNDVIFTIFVDLFSKKMNVIEKSKAATARAYEVLDTSKVKEIWEAAGAEVRLVGSLPMGLLAKHRDIDLHVYSTGISEEMSFAVVAKIAKNPNIVEIKCLNGLHTDEYCIAWHLKYKMSESEIWQIDIIHIERGTTYDGFFEEMAERIKRHLTEDLRRLILQMKYDTPDDEEIHGVEYYEAVIADGVRTLPELREWLKVRRAKEFYYWMPD